MSKENYLLFHRDDPLNVQGVNAGAEMATLWLARYLARAGKNVVVCGQLVDGEETVEGVQFWDVGADYNVGAALARARELGPYHLVATGRAHALLESRGEELCLSRTIISQDRTSNDTGIKAPVLSKIADHIVCVSNAQREFFVADGADSSKISILHNGADLEIFQPGEPVQRNFQKLVFAGALVQDKGIHLLLEAYAQLKAKYSTLSLDVFGSAKMWGREKMFDEAQLEQQLPGVKFHGAVSQTKIAAAYQTAGIAIVPSIWFDPFPLTSVEAQVTGCPVITFNVGGLGEGVVDGVTGTVIEDVSVEALTRAIDELLADPDRLEHMSGKALEIQREKFSWARMSEGIIKLCEGSMCESSDVSVENTKIGFFTTWNQECGLATYAKFLLSQFPADSYVVLAEDTTEGLKGSDEAFVSRCWKRGSTDYTELLRAVRHHGLSTVHFNVHDLLFLQQPAAGQLFAQLKQEGVSVVLQLHSIFTIRPEAQTLLELADLVLVHTPESRLEVIANGALPSKTKVLPHGVNVLPSISAEERASLRRELGMPSDEKIVVTFGFVQPHKGIEGLIESVLELERSGIKARGYVAGKPNEADPNARVYQDQLKQLAAETGVSQRIHFLDRFLSELEVEKFLRAADIVLMNYQSLHYEASGACSLAVGAGACVVTSVAPPFAAFGDAVWHITSGFPAGMSVATLLQNENLRLALQENVARYCKENSWQAVAKKLRSHYAQLETKSFHRPEIKKENVVKEADSANWNSSSGRTIRVLMQNRPNTFSQRGGDTVVMEKTIDGLRRRGVEVTVDVNGTESPAGYDVVHLFNFALPDMLRTLAERAHQAGTPFVVTTLCEDIPAFHNQSISVAQAMMAYVGQGQNRDWLQANWPDITSVQSCDPFENSWVVQHAAGLMTNGSRESEVLRKTFGELGNVFEVKLGHDLGLGADPSQFINQYGERDFIFCVGRLESRKNQLMLLKALEDSELTVVLAAGGFSYQPEYEQAVRSFRRKGKTLILDRLSPEMLSSAYAAAKVHALPSWFELPGLVSLEAAHYGCNVVATQNGTAPDYFGESAFYCDPASESSISNAIIAAYYSPVKPGLGSLVAQYTWDRVAEESLKVYQAVAKPAAMAAPEPVIPNVLPTPEPVPQPQNPMKFQVGVDPVATSTPGPEFDKVLEEGENAAKEREFAKAHECLAKAEEMDPRSLRALRARAAVFMAEENVERSWEYFQKANTIDPLDPKTLSGLGMCEMMRKNPQAAYPYFVKALSQDPEEQVAILQLVECSYVIQRFDDLESVLKVFVQKHPQDMNMQFCYAGCLFKLDRINEAEAINERVLAENSQHAGAMELKQKISEKTVETPKPIPQKAPVTPQAQQKPTPSQSMPKNAAGIDQGFLDNAISNLAKRRQVPADASQPQGMPSQPVMDTGSPIATPQSNLPTAPSSGAQVEEKLRAIEEDKRQKNFKEVIQACDQLLNSSAMVNGQREKACLLRAEALAVTGEVEQAQAVFEEILAQNPKNARAHCGIGALVGNNNDWEGARSRFQTALEIDPRYDVALAGMALCAAQNGRKDEAWEYYQQALRENPENTRALLGIIEIGYEQQRFGEIEHALERYLEMHPADLGFLYSLAGCYFVQGKLQEALSEVSKVTLFDPQHEKALELQRMIDEKLAGQSASVR